MRFLHRNRRRRLKDHLGEDDDGYRLCLAVDGEIIIRAGLLDNYKTSPTMRCGVPLKGCCCSGT